MRLRPASPAFGELRYGKRIVAAAAVGAAALTGCATPTSAEQAPPAATAAPAPAPKPKAPETAKAPEKYPTHHNITATVFFLGEGESADNAYITNEETAWDSNPMKRFGGVDKINALRDGNSVITSFTPKHNPYYIALPASEFTETGPVPGARAKSPWAAEAAGMSDEESLFKGRWVRVERDGYKPVYAQWLDVGPDSADVPQDYGYVFGDDSQKPSNTFNLKAGIDLSPAAAGRLGFNDGGEQVSWSFVDRSDVPADDPALLYAPIDNRTHWE